jgi:hypothetical protein
VEGAHDGLLRVFRSDGADPIDALVHASVERGWGLTHLAPERATLEDVFVQLTQQEGDVQPAEAAA